MPKTLQFRRGTTSELSTVTGAVGELFVDTTKDTVVVMDGTTAGGTPLATEANLAAKQATLVSGTNIKTINGTSILGSGNISISGGGGSSYDQSLNTTDTVEFAGVTVGGNAVATTSAVNYGLSAKQDTLVSGTNIKTVNGTSILGSGDISIAGGGGSDLSQVAEDILPLFTDVYDLGSTSKRWYDAYVANSLDVNGSTIVGTEDAGTYSLTTNADIITPTIIANEALVGDIHIEADTVTPSRVLGQYTDTSGTLVVDGSLTVNDDLHVRNELVLQQRFIELGTVVSKRVVDPYLKQIKFNGGAMTTPTLGSSLRYSYGYFYGSSADLYWNWPGPTNTAVTMFSAGSAIRLYRTISGTEYYWDLGITSSTVLPNSTYGSIQYTVTYTNSGWAQPNWYDSYFDGNSSSIAIQGAALGNTEYYVELDRTPPSDLSTNSSSYVTANGQSRSIALSQLTVVAPTTLTSENINDIYSRVEVNDVIAYVPLKSSIKFKDNTGSYIKAITFNSSNNTITYDGLVQAIEYNSSQRTLSSPSVVSSEFESNGVSDSIYISVASSTWTPGAGDNNNVAIGRTAVYGDHNVNINSSNQVNGSYNIAIGGSSLGSGSNNTFINGGDNIGNMSRATVLGIGSYGSAAWTWGSGTGFTSVGAGNFYIGTNGDYCTVTNPNWNNITGLVGSSIAPRPTEQTVTYLLNQWSYYFNSSNSQYVYPGFSNANQQVSASTSAHNNSMQTLALRSGGTGYSNAYGSVKICLTKRDGSIRALYNIDFYAYHNGSSYVVTSTPTTIYTLGTAPFSTPSIELTNSYNLEPRVLFNTADSNYYTITVTGLVTLQRAPY